MLKQKSKEHTVTLLYGARDEEHNEALVLKRILEGRECADARVAVTRFSNLLHALQFFQRAV